MVIVQSNQVKSPPPVPYSVNCSLCGCNGASVRCEKCNSMAFCIGCDDMYHRHPKRRNHLRQAVALEFIQALERYQNQQAKIQPQPLFDGPVKQDNSILYPWRRVRTLPRMADNFNAHPSKMPVPPPRRKRKPLFAGIKDTFRRFVSPDRSHDQLPNEPIYAKIQPVKDRNADKGSKVLPKDNIQQISNRPSTFRPLPPPPPSNNDNVSTDQIYENMRKHSLPVMDSGFKMKSKLFASINDLTSRDYENDLTDTSGYETIRGSTLPKKNYSCHDLSMSQRNGPSAFHNLANHNYGLNGSTQSVCVSPYHSQTHHSMISPNMFCGGFHCAHNCQVLLPNSCNHCGRLKMTSSTNSLEELRHHNRFEDDNDELTDDEDDSKDDYHRRQLSRSAKNRIRRSNMKRSQSTFSMYPTMENISPSYSYHHDCNSANPPMSNPFCDRLSVNSSLLNARFQVSSPSLTARSFATPNSDQHKSFDNMSDSSSSKSANSRLYKNIQNKSNFPKECQSSEVFDTSNGEEIEEQVNEFGQWSCRFCTFFNDSHKNICEICCKTRLKKTTDTTDKDRAKFPESIVRKQPPNDITSKVLKNDEHLTDSIANDSNNKQYEIEFDDAMIKEQLEIEKELQRRRQNELRIENENRKLQTVKTVEENKYPKTTSVNSGTESLDSKQDSIKHTSSELSHEQIVARIIEEKISEKLNKLKINNTQEYSNEESNTNEVNCNVQSNCPPSAPTSVPEISVETSCITTKTQINANSTSMVSNNPQNLPDYTQAQTQVNNVVDGTTGTSSISTSINQTSNPSSQGSVYISNGFNQTSASSLTPVNNFPTYPANNSFFANSIAPVPNMNIPGTNAPFQNMMNSNVHANSACFPHGMPLMNTGYPPNSIQPYSVYQQPTNQPIANSFGYKNDPTWSQNGQLRNMNRFSSFDDLQSMSSVTSSTMFYPDHVNHQKNQLESGLHIINTLREAEKKGFTADDVEVALQFSSNAPLEWLDDNWLNMCETVLTMANNQIIENERASGNRKNLNFSIITEKDAWVALRICKGNIWQAVEKCIQLYQDNKLFDRKSSQSSIKPFGKNTKSFSLKVTGVGTGKANNDANFVELNDPSLLNETDVPEEEVENLMNPNYNFIRQSKTPMEAFLASSDNDEENALLDFYVRKISGTNANDNIVFDRDQLEELIQNWQYEKSIMEQEREKLKKAEKEKLKIQKMLDLHRRIGGYLSDGTTTEEELDREVEQVFASHEELKKKLETIEAMDDHNDLPKNELALSHNMYNVAGPSGISQATNSLTGVINNDDDYDDDDEDEDVFDQIQERIQSKLSNLLETRESYRKSQLDTNLSTATGSDKSSSKQAKTDLSAQDSKQLSKLEPKTDKENQILSSSNIKGGHVQTNVVASGNINSSQSNSTVNTSISTESSPKTQPSLVSQQELKYNLVTQSIEAFRIETNESMLISKLTPENIKPLSSSSPNKSKVSNDNKKLKLENSNKLQTDQKEKSKLLISSQKSTEKEIFNEVEVLPQTSEQTGKKSEQTDAGKANNFPDSKKDIPESQSRVEGNSLQEDYPECCVAYIPKHNAACQKPPTLTRSRQNLSKSLSELSCIDQSDWHMDMLIHHKPVFSKLKPVGKLCRAKFIKSESDLTVSLQETELTDSSRSLNKFEGNNPMLFENAFCQNGRNNKIFQRKGFESGSMDNLTTLSIRKEKARQVIVGKLKSLESLNSISNTELVKPFTHSSQMSPLNTPPQNAAISYDFSEINPTIDNQNPDDLFEALAIEADKNPPENVRWSKIDYSTDFQWARTEFECELCTEVVQVDDIVVMIACTHFACRECLKKYFTVQIRERQRLVITCPFCEEPNLSADEDDKVFDYLGLFDQFVRHIVDEDVYELFQRKVRDRALVRDPNFLWCPQCSSGFITPNPLVLTVMCPDCRCLTCRKCKKPWKKQHFNLTCEKFAEWEKLNDPQFAEQQLNKHLKEFGIECPNCKFRYQLAKGGCMHFRCIQCSYDFCGGCSRPFKTGNRCFRAKICEKLGLHAHHPRNCLFYLRDKEIGDLQSLLDKHNVQYKTTLEGNAKVTRCQVMEQKETDNGMKDETCNRYIEAAGLCKLHYKEYLGTLVYQNKIDPIHIFSEEELELTLRRENIRLPSRIKDEDKKNYTNKLIKEILEKIPLE